MAYNLLSSARDQYSSFGNSLASIQQNKIDDENSNNDASAQALQIYKQTLQETKLQGPVSLAFGGIELAKELPQAFTRLKNAAMKAKELPSALLDVGKSTAEKLKARGLQASDLLDTAKSKLSGTLADVQSHASDVITQAKNTFDNATLTLKDSANIDELKSNFENLKSDLTGRLANANDIIDSNVKQYSNLADQAKSQIGEINSKMDALKSSVSGGELTGLAKEQFDSLASKLPDLQGQVSKAQGFIDTATKARADYGTQVADQLSQQAEKAKSQFMDFTSKMAPSELQAPEMLPSVSESGQSFFNRIGDMFSSKNTLQPATNPQELIQNLDPEVLGPGSRGIFSSGKTEITSMLPDSSSLLSDIGGAASTGFGFLGDSVGILGGLSSVKDITKGQFNGNDAANAFFGIQGAKSLGDSAVGGLKTAVSSIGEQLSGGAAAVGNVLSSAKEAGGNVITSLSQATESGLDVARGAVSTASDIASKAVSAGSELAGAAGDVIKGAAADVGEGIAEASAISIPVIGEVAAAGLGIYQIYEGFKDLFSKPKMSAPTPIAVPTIANISQSFQSGV